MGMNRIRAEEPRERRDSAQKDRYLTFTLAGEQCAFAVPRVREIRGWEGVTAVADVPDYVLGVMDIRGSDVYVIDLRRRLALDATRPGPRTLVVVLGLLSDGINRPIGFAVDGVCQVQALAGANVQAARVQSAISPHFVRGLATAAGRQVVLLDTDRLIDYRLIDRKAVVPVPGSRRMH